MQAQSAIRVLVMDDEETIQQLLQESLTLMGFEVVVTRDGKGAILAYEKALRDGDAFDIVLMDLVVQGGMGGLAASEEILKQNPDARLVATSGDSLDPVMMHPKLHGFVGQVAKPFNLRALSAFIQQICSS